MELLDIDNLLIEKRDIETIINYYQSILYDIEEKIKISDNINIFNNLSKVYGNNILDISKEKLKIILSNNNFKYYYENLFTLLEENYGLGLKSFFFNNYKLPIFSIKIKTTTDINLFIKAFNYIINVFELYNLQNIETIYILNTINKEFINKSGFIFYINQRNKEQEGINKIYYIDKTFYIYNQYYGFNSLKLKSDNINEVFDFLYQKIQY